MSHSTPLALEPTFITAFNAALAHAKSEALAYILSLLRGEAPSDHPTHRERRLAASALLRQPFLNLPTRAGDSPPPPRGEGSGEGLDQTSTPITQSEPTPPSMPPRHEAARDGCQTPLIRARSASDGWVSPNAGLVTDSHAPPRANGASESHRALAEQQQAALRQTHPKPETPNPKPEASPPEPGTRDPEPARIELGFAFPQRAPTPASRLVAAAGWTRSLDTS